MTIWISAPVNFKYQLSDWVLFTTSIPMQVRAERLVDSCEPVSRIVVPTENPDTGSQGFAIRNLPIVSEQPILSYAGDYLCYIPLQYQHCYIDLSWSFDQYVNKFSSKTRSTVQRKIRKFKEHCGGSIKWKSYNHPDDIPDFFLNASQVSKLTYQERLLDVGLPTDEAFMNDALQLAQNDRLRAYILFDGDQPISYLYCPEKDGVLIYSYLGYDPKYQNLSVGTILQWLAIENIFQENKFKFFDFTEGNSSHKLLFSSHQRLCANIFFVKNTPINCLKIQAHKYINRFSKYLGDTLDKYGIKAKIKKILRRP